MGYFGTFIYADGRWSETADLPDQSPYLRVDIHDSDIATIDYNPTGLGSGRLYLGFEPAIYFEDPEASHPVDADAEVAGPSAWAEQIVGKLVRPDHVRPLLADPAGDDPEEVFVEDSVVKLLAALGCPSRHPSRETPELRLSRSRPGRARHFAASASHGAHLAALCRELPKPPSAR